jgi:hypothetical protein
MAVGGQPEVRPTLLQFVHNNGLGLPGNIADRRYVAVASEFGKDCVAVEVPVGRGREPGRCSGARTYITRNVVVRVGYGEFQGDPHSVACPDRATTRTSAPRLAATIRILLICPSWAWKLLCKRLR